MSMNEQLVAALVRAREQSEVAFAMIANSSTRADEALNAVVEALSAIQAADGQTQQAIGTSGTPAICVKLAAADAEREEAFVHVVQAKEHLDNTTGQLRAIISDYNELIRLYQSLGQ